MSDDKINVKVKMTSNNSTFDISIDKTGTVLDLKKGMHRANPIKRNRTKFSLQRKDFSRRQNHNRL